MRQQHTNTFLLFFLLILFPYLTYAETSSLTVDKTKINKLITNKVKESFSYSGLAIFYNEVTAYIVDKETVTKLNKEEFYTVNSNQSLVLVGHYNLLIATNIDAPISFINNKIIWKETNSEEKVTIQLLLKSDLTQLPEHFQKLRYAHLWEPFRLLCIGIEAILLWLNTTHHFGWGITIILLSLIFKIFMLPANILLIRSQRKVSYIQASLAPELEAIKEKFEGEEAHEQFMATHKAKGVTPFYTLKPLLLTLAPFPFSIAIFNVLGEMDLLLGQTFLWIQDLAYPDAIRDFGVHIPLLGSSVNLLPILMTLLTIFAARLHQNSIISKKELFKQKLNLYWMAFGFLLLFYPFPSSMVLYWTFANIWHFIQQRVIQI